MFTNRGWSINANAFTQADGRLRVTLVIETGNRFSDVHVDNSIY